MERFWSAITGLLGLSLLVAIGTVGWARHRTPFVGWLVFEVSDGTTQHLYRMEADGSNLRKLSSGDNTVWEYPQWSPDGSWILAAENSTHRMIALRPYGTGLMQPIETENFAGITMRWSPDGHQIVYTSFFERYMNVHVASVNGGPSARLTNFGDYRNGNALWSPDSTRLAFLSNRDELTEIYQMDRNGDNLERLTKESHVQTLIDWSPDGEGLYFLDYLNNIVYVSMDGSNQQNIIVRESGRIAATDLSPDGKWLVYVTLYHEGIHQEQKAYLVRTDGSHHQQILDGHELPNDFVWSLDSQWLAFTAEIDGYRQLFRARADGSDIKQLTFDHRDHMQPDWSPIIDKGWSWDKPLFVMVTALGVAAGTRSIPILVRFYSARRDNTSD